MMEQIGASSSSDLDALLVALAPRIALGVIPVLAVLDPSVVVLGGPTGDAGGDRLAELVQAEVKRASRWSPRIVASGSQTNPVLRGARDVLIQEVRHTLLGITR
jgi:predicted NBD/HSP70 family sugar kinase